MWKATVGMGMFIAFGACTQEAVELTELSMNVVTDGEFVSVYFRETARPGCSCSSGNTPAPGECTSDSDGITCSCSPPPADCLEQVDFKSKGTLVASRAAGANSSLWFGYVAAMSSSQIDEVVVQGCGGIAHIPLPTEGFAVATITGVTEVSQSSVRLEWTTDPAAPLVRTTGGNGFVSGTCLNNNLGSIEKSVSGFDPTTISIQPVNLVEEMTPLGSVNIWYGAETTIVWPESTP